MKQLEFTGKLVASETLKNSVWGCPRYYGILENAEGVRLAGCTKSNASICYTFNNYSENVRIVKYHVTKTGNVIFDEMKILK